MNKEENVFLLLVQQLIYSNRKEEIRNCLSNKEICWENFKGIITYHELVPSIYLVIKDYSELVPFEITKLLKNTYYCTLVRCQKIWIEFLRISEAFENAGIIIVPIKGVAFLEDIYKEIPVRMMVDMDLLVNESDILKAEEVLYSLGYIKDLGGLREEYWKESQYHICFFRCDFLLELHWGLDYKRNGKILLSELWGRLREINVADKTIKLLSVEDTLLSLALHNRRFGKPLCLKNVYDLVLLLKKYGSSFDWDYVVRQCKKYKLFSTAFFILCQLSFLTEIDVSSGIFIESSFVPRRIWKNLLIPNWKKGMARLLITSNTFKIKEHQSKDCFLKTHFLLYDSLWEPVSYIINIPLEQFAKYFGLEAYMKKTKYLYRFRLIYFIFYGIKKSLGNVLKLL